MVRILCYHDPLFTLTDQGVQGIFAQPYESTRRHYCSAILSHLLSLKGTHFKFINYFLDSKQIANK